MKFLVWLLVGILFSGCLENRAEFEAINAGKINAVYENSALKMENAPFALFFFTTTCGVCKAQIHILQEMANENIKIYGILGNMPSTEKAKQYAKSNKISLPLFYESKARRFFTQVVGGVKGVPVVVIFDKDGKIKERFIGLTPKSILKSAIS